MKLRYIAISIIKPIKLNGEPTSINLESVLVENHGKERRNIIIDTIKLIRINTSIGLHNVEL